MSNEIKIIEKESPILIKQAEELIISSDTLITATELLSSLNRYNDAMIEELEKVTIPLKTALRAEEARFKPLKTIFKTTIESLRGRLGEYHTQVIKARVEAEQRITDRIKEGKGNLTLETAVNKIEALEIVSNKTETEAGSISFRTMQELELYDIDKIPREYMIPNEAKIKATLKIGQTVAGARMVEKQVVFNSR